MGWFRPNDQRSVSAVTTLAEVPELVGFFSYSREDDEAFRGALSALRVGIYDELSAQLGRSKMNFRLWQDQAAIAPGKLWESEIKAAVDQALFFIPIVTPRAIKSSYCKFEFEAFLARQEELGRNDLVFPILYILVSELANEAKRRDDPILSTIAQRQYVDWRALRHVDVQTTAVREQIESLCGKIVEALNKPWVSPEERRKEAEAKARQQTEEESRWLQAEAKRRAEEEEARKQTEAAAKRRAEEEEARKQAEVEALQRAKDERSRQEAEAKRWAEQDEAFAVTGRADDISAVDAFLANHPESRHTEEARSLRGALVRRNEACEAAMASNDPAVLKAFLKGYPNGAPAEKVRGRLRSLDALDTDAQRLTKKLGISGGTNQRTIAGSVVETVREGLVDSNPKGSKETETEHDPVVTARGSKPRARQERWLATVIAVLVAIGSLEAVFIVRQLGEAEETRKVAEGIAVTAVKARIPAEEKADQAERERQAAEARVHDAEKAAAAMIVPTAAQQGQPNLNQAAAKAILQAADNAIGASGVKSYVASSAGRRGYPGQQFSEGDLPRTDTKGVRTVDFASKSAKTEYSRVQGNNIPRGGGAGFPVQGEQHFVEVVNGNTGWNVNAQGQPFRIAATDAGDRQLSIWTNPIGFIKAGLAAPDAAATDRYPVQVVGFNVKVCDGPQPQCTRRVIGEFNTDNMLERVITWYPDAVLGDKMVELRWSDYRDVGNGVTYPFRLHAHMGDHPLIPGGHNWLDLRTDDVKINVADAQAIPDAVRDAPVPIENRVVSTTLAPGVVLVAGGSHNSVAVEFKDFVTVIEGPLSNERTSAVVAEVHRLFPGKPIRYLVNTHNHFDHLGGVRGFVAEGATVITHERNRNFYQRVVLAPQSRTLQPDQLSQRALAPTGPGALLTFTDKHTISDGNETIELYHVEDLNHSDNMAIVYLPKEKIVINADLYGPPPPGGNLANVNANAVALFRNIKRLNLDVAQHVPIHGVPGSNVDFERIVGRVAARAPAAGGGG
jgi:glyoxylase-like metal-dependent hydrolase (beta-lactamase superfamily II)